MSFSEHFGFSFYDMTILVEKDKHERTRQHEGGHKYFGDEKGAKLTKKEFDPKGTSRVCYEPFPDLQHYYEVGVAGLLAEALAIQRASKPECMIDVARLPALAQQIYDTFKGEKPDPNSEVAMEPYVPMSCSYPSAIKSQLSVSDLSHPIKLGLALDRLVGAMTTVANRLNDVGEWEHFQRFVDREFPQYEE